LFATIKEKQARAFRLRRHTSFESQLNERQKADLLPAQLDKLSRPTIFVHPLSHYRSAAAMAVGLTAFLAPSRNTIHLGTNFAPQPHFGKLDDGIINSLARLSCPDGFRAIVHIWSIWIKAALAIMESSPSWQQT
jgi:hypothetical protein